MGNILPVGLIEDGELAAAAAHDLISEKSVDDEAFDGGAEILRGGAAGRVGVKKTRKNVKFTGKCRGTVQRSGRCSQDDHRKIETRGLAS